MDKTKLEKAIEAVELAQKYYDYFRMTTAPNLQIALDILRDLAAKPEPGPYDIECGFPGRKKAEPEQPCETCGDAKEVKTGLRTMVYDGFGPGDYHYEDTMKSCPTCGEPKDDEKCTVPADKCVGIAGLGDCKDCAELTDGAGEFTWPERLARRVGSLRNVLEDEAREADAINSALIEQAKYTDRLKVEFAEAKRTNELNVLCKDEQLAAKDKTIAELQATLEKENIKEFERGVQEGKASQAIMECQARDSFIDHLKGSLCKACQRRTEQCKP